VTLFEINMAAVELWGAPFTDERETRLKRANERRKKRGKNKRIAG